MGPASVHPQPLFQEKAAREGVEGRSVSREKPILPWNRQPPTTSPLHPHPTPLLPPAPFLPPSSFGRRSSWKNHAVLLTPTSAELNPLWPCRGGRVCVYVRVSECVSVWVHTSIQVLPGHCRLQPWAWERQGASEGKRQPELSSWSLSFLI